MVNFSNNQGEKKLIVTIINYYIVYVLNNLNYVKAL